MLHFIIITILHMPPYRRGHSVGYRADDQGSATLFTIRGRGHQGHGQGLAAAIVESYAAYTRHVDIPG